MTAISLRKLRKRVDESRDDWPDEQMDVEIADEVLLALVEAVEAAQDLRADKYGIPHWPERDTTDSIADFTGRCDPGCLGCKLDEALARFKDFGETDV